MRGAMTALRIICSLAFVAAVVPVAGAWSTTVGRPPGPYYNVVDLGELSLAGEAGAPGDVDAVNDKGVAAGSVRRDGSFFASSWPGGRLSLPSPYLASKGLAINDAGTVAGQVLSCPAGCPDGTLWSDGALWENGKVHPTKPLIVATGINDAGLVVGYDSLNGLGTRAVAYSNGTILTFAPLAQLTNPWVAEAHAVNDGGVVVGESLLEPGIQHAFVSRVLARGVGPTVDLGTLPSPFRESNAFGINAQGDIVGASSVAFGASDCHAVMWVHGKIVDLGAAAPSSWGQTAALGVNDAGDAVGFAGGNDEIDGDGLGAEPGARAVMWHRGVAVDLNAAVPSGWRLSVAHDVNNRGEIVGSGFTAGDPIPHGFMLEPLVHLTAVAVAPSHLIGGATAAATVTLNRPAPPGGETVSVSASLASVTAPASVTVPQGRTTVTFPLPTLAVKQRRTAVVTASLDGEARTATLEIDRKLP